MTEITEQVSSNMQNIAITTSKATAKTLSEMNKLILSLLLALAQKQKDNKLLSENGEIPLKKLYNAVSKGELLKSICVSDSDYDTFKKHLVKQGVLFATTDLNKDDSKMIFFLNRDSEKIKNAIMSLQADKGLVTEIPPDLFITNNKSKEISVANNFDKVELELFRHYAAKQKLVFSSVVNGDNIKIMFNNKDKDKVNDILNTISWDLTSSKGPLIRQQIEYKIAGRQKLNIAVDEAKEDLYIVDSNNPHNYIYINEDKFSYYKNGHEIMSVLKTNPDFKNQCFLKIKALVNPVILMEQEFNVNEQRLTQIIQSKHRVGFCDYDLVDDNIEHLSQQNHEKYENDKESKTPVEDDYYEERKALRTQNKELHHQKAINYLSKFVILNVVVKTRSLEYIIKGAQQLHKEDITKTTHIDRNIGI